MWLRQSLRLLTISWRKRMLKRLFDIVVSAAVLLVLSPLLLVIALWVKLSSPGPMFYKATRVGLHGKEFKLYKFRSMVVGADRLGPGVTGASDPRITPVGKFLRRTKLDEFPQFLNVLRGDMSIVGPRPEDPRYVALYTPEQRKVLEVRPGITSLASVQYRHEEKMLTGEDWEEMYIKNILPRKVQVDLVYLKEKGFFLDFKIVLLTIGSLFR